MLELDADTGDAAVRALHARMAEVSDGITDAPNFLRELEQRMRLAPVCIAEDIALPHARVSRLEELKGQLDEALAARGPFLLEIDMLSIGGFKSTFAGPPTNTVTQIPALAK